MSTDKTAAERELSAAVLAWFEQRDRLNAMPPAKTTADRRAVRAEARALEADWDRAEEAFEKLLAAGEHSPDDAAADALDAMLDGDIDARP